MKRNLLLVALTACFSLSINAQNVGINDTGSAPDSSAILDLDVNDKGFLLPRLTTAERNLIANPAEGLMIYNKDCKVYQFWDNSDWNSFPPSAVALPSAPTANTASNITDTDFDANWQIVNDATGYYIDVSDDINFNNLIISNLYAGNNTTYNIVGLNCNKTYYYRVRAENCGGVTTNSNTITLATDWCYTLCGGGTMTFNDVFNPVTGETWMDRNLGASQVAQSSTDQDSYGDLFQWGREADGHQCRTSGTTGTRSSSDSPGHGNFITFGVSPYDWRDPQNDNLWQGVNGINNPCPPGYRLPTDAELDAERASWSPQNSTGAFGSSLKLLRGGHRNYSSGSLGSVGSFGFYWSSTVSGIYARILVFNSGNAGMNDFNGNRANGYSVRCIKD